jgi:alanyl-tRNA synthetase
MLNLTSEQLREKWKSFWLTKNHVHLPEASLIADKESTALFNVA